MSISAAHTEICLLWSNCLSFANKTKQADELVSTDESACTSHKWPGHFRTHPPSACFPSRQLSTSGIGKVFLPVLHSSPCETAGPRQTVPGAGAGDCGPENQALPQSQARHSLINLLCAWCFRAERWRPPVVKLFGSRPRIYFPNNIPPP